MNKKFDVIVIGSGAAGFAAAQMIRAEGKSVCVIEGGAIGGECPNNACIPTKALLHSAKSYYKAKNHLADIGVYAPKVSFRFSKIMNNKTNVVDLVTGEGKRIEKLARKLGIKIIKGYASFVGVRTIEVKKKRISGKVIILATGATDFIPPIAGLEEVDYWTYKDAVSAKKLPKSIAIVGAGPVGCEFATFFNMLGSTVTMLQMAPRILHREDKAISIQAEKSFMDRGATILTNTKTLSVYYKNGKIAVTYQQGKETRKEIVVEKVLIAAGKRANIQNINLQKTAVKTDEKGRLILTESLQTTAPHIFAAGDVTGKMMFTHTAHHEAQIVAHNVLEFLKKKNNFIQRDLSIVPRATFVEPEIASVGITEMQAKEQKMDYRVGTFQIASLGRSVTDDNHAGLVKIIIDLASRKILGGHIIGPRAGELIHEIALAMHASLTVDALAEMLHAFPTYSEAVLGAASSIE